MSKKKTHEQFVQELKLIQPNLTVLSVYTNNRTKITVKCCNNVLYNSSPINLLRGELPSIKNSIDKTENFKAKLKIIQPKLTLIGNYLNSKINVLIKDEKDLLYKVKPKNLLRGFTPCILSAVNKTEVFIKMCNEVHKNKYSYDKTIYLNNKSEVIITCPTHGDFKQLPHVHSIGNGCKLCANENNPGSYSSIYKYSPKSEVFIYLFKFYKDNEVFYKIGLSNNPFKRQYNFPYKVEIISFYKSNVEELYPIEQTYHDKFKNMNINYKPKKFFAGWTECFGYGVQ